MYLVVKLLLPTPTDPITTTFTSSSINLLLLNNFDIKPDILFNTLSLEESWKYNESIAIILVNLVYYGVFSVPPALGL